MLLELTTSPDAVITKMEPKQEDLQASFGSDSQESK